LKPLISIVIPTYNSARTLPLCIASIKMQRYPRYEIIVVDSGSRDATVEIAKAMDARVIRTSGGLLWARYIGHKTAQGDIEVLMDSDQLLYPGTLDRIAREMEKHDRLILGEDSYKPHTITQILFMLDRRHVHEIKDLHPVHGVLLARAYHYPLLDKAFQLILETMPRSVIYRLVSQDHAIINYEAWRLSGKPPGILEHAILHIEPDSLGRLIRKFYRYGCTEHELSKYYPHLARGKHTPRKPSPKPEWIASIILWLIKAIPYAIGRLAWRMGACRF